MNKTAIIEQADEFKAKFGEYPKYPIRIRYKWMSTRAEGDLRGPIIFGFPGVVGATDSEVTELAMLYDGDKRNFPKYDDEISAKKKREETIVAQEPLPCSRRRIATAWSNSTKKRRRRQRFGVKGSIWQVQLGTEFERNKNNWAKNTGSTQTKL